MEPVPECEVQINVLSKAISYVVHNSFPEEIEELKFIRNGIRSESRIVE